MTARRLLKNAGHSETWEDPIVAEIRAVRDRLAARFDYDVDRIFDHFESERAERQGKGSEKSSSAKAT